MLTSLKFLGTRYRQKMDNVEETAYHTKATDLDKMLSCYRNDKFNQVQDGDDLMEVVEDDYVPQSPKKKRNLLAEAKSQISNQSSASLARGSSFAGNDTSMKALPELSIAPCIPMAQSNAQLKNMVAPIFMGITLMEHGKVEEPTPRAVLTKKSSMRFDLEGDQMLNQYKFQEELGKGAFGIVHLAIDTETNEKFAIKALSQKLMKKKSVTISKENFNLFQKEIAIMKKIDHPNLICLREVIEDDLEQKLYLIMDFMDIGALGSSRHMEALGLEPDSRIPEPILRNFYRGCLFGLDYMHNIAKVIHCDIKPENILVNSDGQIKISDFGISKSIENPGDKLSKIGGTKIFLPPETWKSEMFDGPPVDIWSLAVSFYYLFYRKYPLYHQDPRKFEEMAESMIPEYEPGISDSFKDLLSRSMEKDPKQRMTLHDCFIHPWITNNGEEPMARIINLKMIEVTPEEIRKAVSKKQVGGLFKAATFGAKMTKRMNTRTSQRNVKVKTQTELFPN